MNAAQLRHVVQRLDWTGKTPDGLEIDVGSIRIDGQHTLSMEDGVRSAIALISKRFADPAPAVRRADVFVNGFAGRRLSYARQLYGGVSHVEALVIQNSRSATALAITYGGDSHNADVTRILRSVEYHPAN